MSVRAVPGAALVVLIALAALPASALAHATLEQTTPERGAVARTEPRPKDIIMKRITLASAITAGALAVPAAAQAHVTLQPRTAPAGGFVVEDVRVPNETDDAVTTRVAVWFPRGFAEASYQTVPGWSVQVVKEKLAQPVTTDDGQVTEAPGRRQAGAAGPGDGPRRRP